MNTNHPTHPGSEQHNPHYGNSTNNPNYGNYLHVLHEDITTGIGGDILTLLPSILANPDVVFGNREFGELRPHAFISNGTWLGQTKPVALGVLLESWLTKGELQVTAEELTAHHAFEEELREAHAAEFGEKNDEGHTDITPDHTDELQPQKSPEPLPYKRLFLYRVNGSALSGSHIARGIDPDTGLIHAIGHSHYNTRLPGAFHSWFKRFKQAGERTFKPGITGHSEQDIVSTLKEALRRA